MTSKSIHVFDPENPTHTVFLFVVLVACTIPNSFIFGISIPIYSTIGWILIRIGAQPLMRTMKSLLIISVVTATLLFIGLQKDNIPVESMKGAAGFSAFSLTMLFAAPTLRNKIFPQAVYGAVLVHVAFFLLEYFEIFSAKQTGIVRWWSPYLPDMFDIRPSGLLGEPSWFGMTLGALALFATRPNVLPLTQRYTVALAAGLCLALSHSAIALLFLGLVLIQIFASADGGRAKAMRIAAIALPIVAVPLIVALGAWLAPELFRKITDPLSSASGRIRFDGPIYYLTETVLNSPFTGRGISYISTFLVGKMGTAILPVNVLIDLGLFGIVVYGALIAKAAQSKWPPITSFIALFAVLFGLGMEYNPFQALLICLCVAPDFARARNLNEDIRGSAPRPHPRNQHA